MSSDKCINKYFSWDANSCYIDSLFVALFHSEHSLIDNFVNNLQVKNNYDKQINNNDFAQLELYGTILLTQIKDIYAQLKIHHNDDKKDLCINFRTNLQKHFEIIQKYYKFTFNNNFISETNNPIDVLLYLYTYVFTDSNFNNITNISTSYYDYNINNFNFITNSIQNINTNQFSDINFINIFDNSYLNDFKLKEIINNNLVLHSIIVNTGSHYICYYKCNNNWYIYNDLISKVILIENIENVNKDILNTIYNLNSKEIILLYLNSPKQQPNPQPKQQPKQQPNPQPKQQPKSKPVPTTTHKQSDHESIIQLKKLIEIHFNKLND
jgi:hypothetical protein